MAKMYFPALFGFMERELRERTLGRARAATVVFEDRALFVRAPRRERRRRERLVRLVEARLHGGVLAPAEEHVVHALEIRSLARPAPIAPHDLAREAVVAEDLVAEHL